MHIPTHGVHEKHDKDIWLSGVWKYIRQGAEQEILTERMHKKTHKGEPGGLHLSNRGWDTLGVEMHARTSPEVVILQKGQQG